MYGSPDGEGNGSLRGDSHGLAGDVTGTGDDVLRGWPGTESLVGESEDRKMRPARRRPVTTTLRDAIGAGDDRV